MITVCEPQCWGFEHVVFNAAFLHSVVLAAAGERVEFLAEDSHLAQVREKYTEIADPGTVAWRVISIPDRDLINTQRVGPEYRLVISLVKHTKKYGSRLLMLTSVTSQGLLALKLNWRKLPHTTTVIHGVLNSLLMPAARRPWNRAVSLKTVLPLFNRPNINYLVLGQSIRQELLKHYPRLAPYVYAIHHPYIFPDAKASITETGKQLNFGFIGVGSETKGICLFFKAAELFAGKAQFTLVGRVNKGVKIPPQVLRPPQDKPVDRNTFEELTKTLDYAVFPYQPQFYQLVASGAFLDAVAYAKPIIVLENSYFRNYFTLGGDIGYCCQDENALIQTIGEIIENFSKDRYLKQCKNIANLMHLFTTDSIANQLKKNSWVKSKKVSEFDNKLQN